jgi:hypothetical protein
MAANFAKLPELLRRSPPTPYPLSIGGVEYPLPVIGGNSRDKSHGSPCCCNR